MKLLYAPQSPFARKVRAAAIELSLDERIELEYAEVIPGRPNVHYAQSANPLRKITALITDEGEIIFDSTVICEYLDSLAGGGILIPLEGPRHWRVLTSHSVAQGLCESVILIRYETWLRPEANRWPVWIDDHWDKIHSGLNWFDRCDAELRNPIDLAQIALGCALGYIDFRWPDHGWRWRYPRVAKWFARLEERPSFSETRPQPPPQS